MSKHEPTRRLAVLESVLEGGLSIREAAKQHDVDRNSVWSWTMAHRKGSLTLAMLRAQLDSAIKVDRQIDIEAEPVPIGYERLEVALSPQAYKLLRELHATGLFGLSIEAVAEEMLLRELRKYIDLPKLVLK